MALFNNVIEYDCTTKCKLIYHAQEIRRAISWKEVNETTIAAFIMKTCQNYLNVVDELVSMRFQLNMYFCNIVKFCPTEYYLIIYHLL